jgi:ABC-type transport system involved in cytochrome bd biosynthesis fused ATPase/permease subunit
VIAHRISSARRAGRILLLDGDEACLGSHAELLLASPRYADLAPRVGGLRRNVTLLPSIEQNVTLLPNRVH